MRGPALATAAAAAAAATTTTAPTWSQKTARDTGSMTTNPLFATAGKVAVPAESASDPVMSGARQLHRNHPVVPDGFKSPSACPAVGKVQPPRRRQPGSARVGIRRPGTGQPHTLHRRDGRWARSWRRDRVRRTPRPRVQRGHAVRDDRARPGPLQPRRRPRHGLPRGASRSDREGCKTRRYEHRH